MLGSVPYTMPGSALYHARKCSYTMPGSVPIPCQDSAPIPCKKVFLYHARKCSYTMQGSVPIPCQDSAPIPCQDSAPAETGTDIYIPNRKENF